MSQQKTNPRKSVTDVIKAAALLTAGQDFSLSPDPTNPYAFVVDHSGKRFRVVVKELA